MREKSLCPHTQLDLFSISIRRAPNHLHHALDPSLLFGIRQLFPYKRKSENRRQLSGHFAPKCSPSDRQVGYGVYQRIPQHLMPCNAHCQHCATKIPLWQLATQICHYNIDLGLSKIQKTITSHGKGVPHWTQRRMLSSADVGLPVQMAGGKVSLSRAVHKNSTRHTL